MFLTIIVFALVLGVLVLVHEAGHFLVAKRNGVEAEEFGFGFPPRMFGVYRNRQGKWKFVWGGREIKKEERVEDGTVYSMNWIPIGGFVKIKGEDGEDKSDPKSFASRPVWTRFKILSAGVAMNFLLGIVLLAFALQIGLPEEVGDDEKVAGAKISITQVLNKAPAEEAGIEIGDEIISVVKNEQETKISSVVQFQEFISSSAGESVQVKVKHYGQESDELLDVNVRKEAPAGEGLIGVALAKTAMTKHGFFESFWLATKGVANLTFLILAFVWKLLVGIFTTQPVTDQVAGPVGIAVLTGQVARLGLAYILQFAAVLSVNLAILNFFPFPALDGGRIVFLLIEKIKGSPVSQKLESIIHAAGFALLIGVMILVTVKDFMNFEIISRLKNLFM